jgi:hypothetical protein
MWFLWVKYEKVPRAKSNGCPYSGKTKITYNAITGSIMAFINMGLDDGHCEVLVSMTPEVNINAKTHAIVDPS